MKKNKTIILAVIILSFYLTLFIAVSTSQAIKLDLQQPFSTLTQELDITGDSIGVYVSAAYVFGSAVIIVLAILMIIIAGIEWITAAGSPEKIGKARDRILKALLGLIIVIFAVFMLETVSPGTVKLASITPEEIKALPCCEVSSGNFEFVNSETECTKTKKGTIAAELKCLKTNNAPPSLATSTCAGTYNNCTACETDTKCEWRLPAGGSGCTNITPGECIAKITSPGSTERHTLNCVQQTTQSACTGLASTFGCVWSKKFCSIKKSLTTPPATDACKSIIIPNDCANNGNCEWYDPGCTTQDTLAYQLTVTDGTCDKRITANCTTYKCYWQSTACSGANCCRNIVSLGQICNFHEDCGSTAYCDKSGTCFAGDLSGGYISYANLDGTCNALLTPTTPCWGKGGKICYTPGIFADCDRCCASGKCEVIGPILGTTYQCNY